MSQTSSLWNSSSEAEWRPELVIGVDFGTTSTGKLPWNILALLAYWEDKLSQES